MDKDQPKQLRANRRGVFYVEASDLVKQERVRKQFERAHDVFKQQQENLGVEDRTREPAAS